MTINLNQYPYFDNFDPTKDFHQILFRPGIPIQSTELTQSQSMWRNQLSRFGDHVFSNGSRVTGGQAALNANVHSVSIASGYNTLHLKTGYFIKGQTSGMVGEIMDVIPATTSTDAYIIYIPRGRGTNGFNFTSGESISPYSDATLTTLVAIPCTATIETSTQVFVTGFKDNDVLTLSSLSGISIGTYMSGLGLHVIEVDPASNNVRLNGAIVNDKVAEEVTAVNQCSHETALIGVDDGVFYLNGDFVRVGKQHVIPNPATRYPTATVGLVRVESIVTSDDDSSLLDPAQGANNYAAPGADRLKISLTLTSYSDIEFRDASFVELIRVERGVVTRNNKYTEYGEIMKTIARRTYDESGNYVVNPFIVNLKDYGDPSTITAVIHPGKAYVGGYEFETISPYRIAVERALDVETSTNFGIKTYLGNYLTITNPLGQVPVYGSTLSFKLGATVLGTATLIQTYPSLSGTRIYLADISGNIATATSISSGSFSATIGSGIVDSNAKSLVFKAPQGYVQSINNISYATPRLYRNVVFNNGVAILTTYNSDERFVGGSGILSNTVSNTYFGVFGAGTATVSQVDIKTVSANSAAQCEVTITDTAYNGFGDVLAMVDVNTDAGRVKTKTTHGVSLTNLTTTPQSLGRADLYAIRYASELSSGMIYRGAWSAGSYVMNDVVHHNGVIYSASGTTSTEPGTNSIWLARANVADQLLVDNGQRDTYYDHAKIKSKTATYGSIVVCFDYFSHSGNGPITVSSYPVEYADIPSYLATDGSLFQLRDSVDFRPRRTDDSTSLVFDSVQISDDVGIETDITYYLARIDKLVLTNNRSFEIIRGVSSFNTPMAPAERTDAMTLATLVLPPYTADIGKVRIDVVNNRRYTMKDIGKLDKRLGNVEYYTSLNSLESKVVSNNQYAPNGTELFKSGFITDSFESFTTGNVRHPEYKCSVDTNQGICRPRFKMSTVAYAINTALSTTVNHNGIVTLPFTEKAIIVNRSATGISNINPFNVLTNIGVVKISPSSDYWFDTNTLPQINVLNENTTAFTTAQTAAAAINANAQWSSWTTSWTGTPVVSKTTFEETTTTEIKKERYRSQQSVQSDTVVSSDNTAIVSKELVPYVRQNEITFSIDGLLPHSRVFAWIDDVNVNNYITPDITTNLNRLNSIKMVTTGSGYAEATTTVTITGGGGSGATAFPVISEGKVVGITVSIYGDGYTSAPTVTINGAGTGATAVASINSAQAGADLYADARGHASGKLIFPNDSKVKFQCGKHRIIFGDAMLKDFSSSYADAFYTAEGYLNTYQRTLVSTRVPITITNNVYDYSTSSSVTTRSITPPPAVSPKEYPQPTPSPPRPAPTPVRATTPAPTSSPGQAPTQAPTQAPIAQPVKPIVPAVKEYNYVYELISVDSKDKNGLPISWGTTDGAENAMVGTSPSDNIRDIFVNMVASYVSAAGITTSFVSGIISSLESVLSANGACTIVDSTPYPGVGRGNWVLGMNAALSWVVKAVRENLTAAQVAQQFGSTMGKPYGPCTGNDPLAQSFIIDSEHLPNGCFLSSMDFYFQSVDPTMPVIMELRPMVNGYPSSNVVIPLSTVVKYPSAITVSDYATASTTFTFDAPVYLAPGEYAVVLKTGSNKYNVFVSEMNKVILGTTEVVSQQPYIGSLFESQNASTWTATQMRDICFTMKICEFDTAVSRTLVVDSVATNTPVDLIHHITQVIQPTKTDISANLTLPNYAGIIPINQDIPLSSRNTLVNKGDGRVIYTLTSSDKSVSPVIDLERNAMICIENLINDATTITIPETDKRLGDAQAKYVMNQVTLNQDFNANNLVTYVNVNRPAGSKIEVYARMKNEYDSVQLADKAWVLLTQEIDGGYTSQDDRFVEDKWSIYDYSDGGFETFNQFEIKIVMLSSNPAKVPVIADIRGIALA